MKGFGWKLFLKRIHTRHDRKKQCVIQNEHDILCVFCFMIKETLQHLLFLCPFVFAIWF